MPKLQESPLAPTALSPGDELKVLSGNYWAELRVFLAVAKAKSFSRAAVILGSSQPTVGRQVKRLQDLIGTQLLIATKTGVALTREGEVLARSLSDVDNRLKAISSSVQSDRSGIEGTVRLSVTEGLAALFLVPNVHSLTEQHNKLDLYSNTLST